MSKQLITIINTFLIISILNLTISQNIITSWHYDKVQMYDLQKIGTILSTQIKEKATSFPSFTEDSITITNLNLLDVQQTLYDSYLNFKTGLLLFTPNKVSLSFNFSYSYSSQSGSASFDLKINVLKMRLANNKTDQTQTFTVSMFSTENDYSVFEISDKELSAKVKTALYKGFESKKILDYISSKIDLLSYYKEFYRNKRDFNFETSTFFDSKKISVSLNRFLGFCEDVTGKAESALCYYSGELNEEDKKDKSKVPLSNNAFVNPNDTYNVFINMDLYNKIINKIMNDGLSEKTFNKNSVVKKLSYDFTVSSLKKYFKGLENYGNDEEFEAKITINELNSKSTKFNAIFNIGNNKNVFSLDLEMDISLKVEVTRSVRLNICLENVQNLKVTVKTGNVSIIDKDGLNNAVEETFDYQNLPICLSDDGMSFRDYYSIITKAYCEDEGFYLEGNQLYQ